MILNEQALQVKQLEALLADVDDEISILANTSAFLNEILDHINWVGFYVIKEGKLKLSAFQGKVACTVIEIGKGVCGTAILNDCVLRVANVHEFPTHIACDSASNSEIVLPLHVNGQIYGVLDIDSPLLNRFSTSDETFLKKCANQIEQALTRCVHS